jgi:hypothetical protein
MVLAVKKYLCHNGIMIERKCSSWMKLSDGRDKTHPRREPVSKDSRLLGGDKVIDGCVRETISRNENRAKDSSEMRCRAPIALHLNSIQSKLI